MTSKSDTFCNTPKYIHLCSVCERRKTHKVNKVFNQDEINSKEYSPEKTEGRYHCDGWITYPLK